MNEKTRHLQEVVLFGLIVFADHTDPVRNQAGSVEPHAELSYHEHVAANTQGLHGIPDARCRTALLVIHKQESTVMTVELDSTGVILLKKFGRAWTSSGSVMD